MAYFLWFCKQSRYTPKYILVVVTCLIFLTQPKSVWGATKGSMRVSPAFVEINSQQNTISNLQIPIEYTNTSTHPIHVELSYLPVTFAKDEAKMQFPITKSVLSSHLIPSNTSFEVASGETKTIVLTSVDTELLPDADYYEALVARITPFETTTTTTTGVVGNITTLILMKKNSGDVQPIYSVTKGSSILPTVLLSYPTQIAINIKNNGRTYGIPRGVVKFVDMFGRTVRQGVVNNDSARIFPDTSRLIRVALLGDTIILPMHYGYFDWSIYDQYTKITGYAYHDRQMYIYVNPYFCLSLLVIAGLIMLFLIYAKARIRHKKATSLDATSRSSDNQS